MENSILPRRTNIWLKITHEYAARHSKKLLEDGEDAEDFRFNLNI